MGIKDWLGLSSESIAKPIKALGDLYTTDKARIESETKYEEVVQKPTLAQIGVNAVLATSASIYNSGWQPLIGWTAGFLILLYYAPQLIVIIVVWGCNCIDSGVITPFPMKPDKILSLVWLLFGFGGYSLIKRR